jgi:transcriptional repressor NrdR
VRGYAARVHCPHCAYPETKVVDSRPAEDGSAIRRRRECLACSSRFTTFERAEEQPLVVRKRSGAREPFEAKKIVTGVSAACKGRPVGADEIVALAAAVEDLVRGRGEVSSEDVGQAVLERLQQCDHVAYLRFASVYKGFADAEDFARELRLLERGGRAAV